MDILREEAIDVERVAELCSVGIKRRELAPRDRSLWHVTNLLESAQMIVKGKVAYAADKPPEGLMSLGKIWESAVDCYMQQYAVDHGGFYTPDVVSSADGITASLDGIMYLPDPGLGWIVCETKLRFSMKRDIPFSHLQQVRAYCHLAGTRRVCLVSGHVSCTPPAMEATLRILSFEPQAIEETWQSIVNTKSYLEGQGCAPAVVVDSGRPRASDRRRRKS